MRDLLAIIGVFVVGCGLWSATERVGWVVVWGGLVILAIAIGWARGYTNDTRKIGRSGRGG